MPECRCLFLLEVPWDVTICSTDGWNLLTAPLSYLPVSRGWFGYARVWNSPKPPCSVGWMQLKEHGGGERGGMGCRKEGGWGKEGPWGQITLVALLWCGYVGLLHPHPHVWGICLSILSLYCCHTGLSGPTAASPVNPLVFKTLSSFSPFPKLVLMVLLQPLTPLLLCPALLISPQILPHSQGRPSARYGSSICPWSWGFAGFLEESSSPHKPTPHFRCYARSPVTAFGWEGQGLNGNKES